MTGDEANLARGATADAYHLVEQARAMTGPGVDLTTEQWMGRAAELMEGMALELEAMSWWVPELVTPERAEQFRVWKDRRRRSLRA